MPDAPPAFADLRKEWESEIFNCSCRHAERALRAAVLRC